ncbi:unnamed protein product [Spirodela intermedia]|uniref:Transmembrane 9 superfamily member n=1 Tax=Spirodela intermedia TaxID=51605 RepID=A0A7I8J9X8_SPIIN|nr:unnamed protein product [Spirodela intermedia]CAA6667026.1 unnamed protein product [Spirodela intermedia]
MWRGILLAFLLLCGSKAGADGSDHKYSEWDLVPLYANKVGPFSNPSETYRYYDLPFCSPGPVTEKRETLGEVLNGDRLVDAPYELRFRKDLQSKTICSRKLTKEEVAILRDAVKKEYLKYDHPPEFKYLLYTHIHFDVLYKGDQVIEINIQRDPEFSVDITEDKEMEVSFSYSATWKETDIPFGKRMEKYSMTYSLDEESAEDQELTGWKSIHGDVFRFPEHKSLFSAVLGSGTQLLALALLIFLLAQIGVFYPYNRGACFTALVLIYALTSGIAGYTATSMYLQLEGDHWVRNLLLTGCLFSGPVFLTFCFLNAVAIAYGATAALPFGTILVILLIWALVTLPLLVVGGVAAKWKRVEFQAPCRTTKVPREIPPLRWYRGTEPQIAMAGLWGHRIYTTYGILFIVFIILIIVTCFITMVMTYFQLAVEDHNWWWRSVLCGGSTGVFILLYCFYYYHTSFFFGYMICISYGFFLMLGTVGFRASLLFVRYIYRSIKCE